jgi:hypothetical protein
MHHAHILALITTVTFTPQHHPDRDKRFSIIQNVQTSSGGHPFSYSVGSEVSSMRVKQVDHEADYSPSCGAEVKNVWGYTSTVIIFHYKA